MDVFKRTMPALLVASALGGGLAACGGTSGDPSQTSSRSGGAHSAGAAYGPGGFLKSDGDNDPDDHSDAVSKDDSQEFVEAVRHGASAADRKAVTAAIRSYYAASTAGDGTQGCALLDSGLAASLQDEQPGHTGSGTCAASLSRLLVIQHRHLAAEEPRTMVVTGVHVAGDVALATLGFKAAPESELILQRQGGAWKINALFDSVLP